MIQAMCNCAHHEGHHKVLVDIFAASTLKSWPHNLRFSPICLPVYEWQGTAEPHAPVTAEERE